MKTANKGTVYVVDDDEAVRDSLQWLLEGNDYRVRCFESAEGFLTRFDPREIACLIVDVRMPGMNGLELQDELLRRGCTMPLVFITGHGDVPMAVDTMKKGAIDFIEKPFNEVVLRDLVDRMLQKARLERWPSSSRRRPAEVRCSAASLRASRRCSSASSLDG